ncbi:MAG: HU family DNA-binding protein [Pseudomonadota bacterium]
MNKSELISLIAEKTHLPKVTVSTVLDVAMEAITDKLAEGETVQFLGFGAFSVGERKARTGRNPQTGKELKIAARRVARFKPGAALTAAVNKGK